MLETGAKIANFVAPATVVDTFDLSDYAGRLVVLYFYPKDDTPGCTTQGKGFAEHYATFKELGAEIVGVSRDSIKSHERFAEKYQLPFPLIADTEEALCQQFEVIKEKNMYGRKVMGIERSTFLIDGDRKLLQEWRKVRVPGHVEKVLEAVKEQADS